MITSKQNHYKMKIYNINTETESGLRAYKAHCKTDSHLFRAIEKEFDKFIKDSNPASEYEDKYFSEDAIYSKKYAIIAAIDQIFEVMDEYKIPFIFLNDNRLDLAAAFQD